MSSTPEKVDHVEASLNYLTCRDKRPIISYEPPAGTPPGPDGITTQNIAIHNGRQLVHELSLDKQGFVLIRHETAVSNFYDAAEVRSVYYPELARLVKDATGASKVLVFDHNVRCGTAAERRDNGIREPVMIAHTDYTVRSGPQRVRDLLGEKEALELFKYRFALINVWRPIHGPVQESPLAICDAQSISQHDLIATDLKYSDRTGEIYLLVYSATQRWFYFPQMQRNEALLFKCFDSDEGRTRFAPHSAFEDPSSPPDAQPRQSIEARTLVLCAP